MLSNKIYTTTALRNSLAKKRKEKKISGNQLSEELHQAISYIAAVENNRIKSISKENLLYIIKKLYDVESDDEAERIANELLSQNDNNNIDNDNLSSTSNITKYETLKDDFGNEQIDDFTNLLNDLLKKAFNKQPQIVKEVLLTMPQNFNFDIGFMLAIFQFPFFVLKNNDFEEKQQFLIDLAKMLKQYNESTHNNVADTEDATDFNIIVNDHPNK